MDTLSIWHWLLVLAIAAAPVIAAIALARGTLKRAAFAIRFVVSFALMIVTAAIAQAYPIAGVLSFIVNVLIFRWTAMRLNGVERNRWWAVLWFVPPLGLIMVIVLCVKRGAVDVEFQDTEDELRPESELPRSKTHLANIRRETDNKECTPSGGLARSEAMGDKRPLRWILKIETTDDARKAMRVAYITYYVIAPLQLIPIGIGGAGLELHELVLLLLAGPLLTFLLALLIHILHSRIAAGILLMMQLVWTLGAIVSPAEGETTASLVVLSTIHGFLIFAVVMGLRGTIRYRSLAKESRAEDLGHQPD